jgi:hypothetical protein
MEYRAMASSEKSKPKSDEPRPSDQKPLKVLRVGAIAASVWRRQTPTGFEYLDFSLSRSWRPKNGEREGYSQSFFEHNEEALFEVISQACRFIRDAREDQDVSDLIPPNIFVGDSEKVAA